MTRTGFRRDVRRFLTWLVGFLVVLILTLLLFLRHDLARTEETIDRSHATIADVAADTINNTPPANLETQLVFLRSRFGVASAEIEARSLEIGAADFLRKPIRKEVLLPRVRAILQRRERARVS